MDLSTLTVDRLVIHEIPQRFADRASDEPYLSDAESALDDDLKRFFRERLVRTLTSPAAVDVVADPQVPGQVPELVRRVLAGGQPDPLVACSKEVAIQLHASQKGSSNKGLLCVTRGTCDGGDVVGILKLTHETGARVEHATGGTRQLSVEFIRSLMLSDATKVFKAGLFWLAAEDEYKGIVSDQQRGYAADHEVADFFLRQFLGCRLALEPDIETARFLNHAESYLAKVPSPERQAKYEVALLAELSSNAGTLSPRAFAARHLKGPDRSAFEKHMSEAGFVPAQGFVKDTSRISKQLRHIAVRFEGGTRLLAPADYFDKSVTLKDLDDGRTQVEFTDRIEGIKRSA